MPPGRGRDPAGKTLDQGPSGTGSPEDLEPTRTELELVTRQLEADIDAHRRNEQELGLLHTLAEEISSARDLEAALEAVLTRICEASGFTLGEAWLPDEEGAALVAQAQICETDPPEGWAQATQTLQLAPGHGLPGEAWQRDEVVWAEDISEDETLPRSRSARDAGLRAGVAIPISGDDQVEAVLMFVVDEPRPRDRRFVRVVSTIAHNLASWVHRRRLQDALRERTRELEDSNRELTRFAYAAAHDLQEPLRDVVRFVQRIEERLGDRLDEDTREDLDYAVDGAKRLHDQLNTLLRYIEAGDSEGVAPCTDAGDVLDAVLDDLAPKLDAADAQVSYDDLPELPLAWKDLATLLEALVDNAITYNDADPPRVEVSARRTPGAWLVTVQDNGVGIPSAYQEKVFDLFERLNRDGPPGAGVGLSLCRRIAERYGGHILLASEPGEGTTVTVRLPDDDARRQADL